MNYLMISRVSALRQFGVGSLVGRRHYSGSRRYLETKNGRESAEFHFENNQFTQKAVKETVGLPSSKVSSMNSVFRDLFLPVGYPKTVSSDYTAYSKWMFFQNILGSAGYVLSTHALLSSVGVSTSMYVTLPFAAAISWVLKDGLGAAALVLFASKYSKMFDIEIKKYKFRGDVLHNAGVLLEMCTPFFPGYFLLSASVSNLSKGIAGLIYGSTRASLFKSFSLHENLGDVFAKYQSQGMAAYLIGMGVGSVSGIALTSTALPSTPATNLLFAAGLSAVHLYIGYRGVKSIELPTLNKHRALLLISNFYQPHPDPSLFSIKSINSAEQFITTDAHITMMNEIRLGSSLAECLKSPQSRVVFDSPSAGYLIIRDASLVHVLYYETEALSDAVILESYFHAVSLKLGHDPTPSHLASFKQLLAQHNWKPHPLMIDIGEFRIQIISDRS